MIEEVEERQVEWQQRHSLSTAWRRRSWTHPYGLGSVKPPSTPPRDAKGERFVRFSSQPLVELPYELRLYASRLSMDFHQRKNQP